MIPHIAKIAICTMIEVAVIAGCGWFFAQTAMEILWPTFKEVSEKLDKAAVELRKRAQELEKRAKKNREEDR